MVHRVPDALEHEPSGLLSDAETAPDFIAADAVLAVGQHPHRREPFVESNGRVFKDRTHFNRELLLAIQAFPHQPRLEERQPPPQTFRAERAVWPADVSNRFDAGLGVRKEPYGI